MESGPQFSPDGTKVAFESTRSGAYEIWLCRSDGSNLMQLTHFNPSVTGTRWSPTDSGCFRFSPAGNSDIFVVDFKGARPVNLPASLQTKACQVGPETADGYISHQIAPVVGKYGKRLGQVGPLYK
jgi:Tol biopolymer transport system component